MDEACNVCKMTFIHLADVVVVAEDEYEIRAVVRPIVVLFLVRVKENRLARLLRRCLYFGLVRACLG